MEELTCANCPFDIEQPNGKPFCIQDATCEISVNWLNEYEQKIYNQALEDFYNGLADELLWVRERFGDDIYMKVRCSAVGLQNKLTK